MMKDVLSDVRQKLSQGVYQNEEHVRMSLVARVLQELGWDIWDPLQCNTEYVAVPVEDRTKVDVALFLRPNEPSVFIEVKAPGKIARLDEIERQLRDYNRNNTALFCIITDGRTWHFYYSQTGGEFSKKRFKDLDMLADDPGDLERAFAVFLSKGEIETGRSKQEAESLLRLSQKQRCMEECVPKARRLVQEPPFPALPDALVNLLLEQGFRATRDEAAEFIKAHAASPPDISRPPNIAGVFPEPERAASGEQARNLDPEKPQNLKFTNVQQARIGDEKVDSWNTLVAAGIRIAFGRGYGIDGLKGQQLTVHVKEGTVTDSGFSPVSGTNVSMQGMEANRAWPNALALAKMLRVDLEVRFEWRNRPEAAFPGERGVLRWSPG